MTAILESTINPDQFGLFEFDMVTHMTQRKSDPFNLDVQIDPTGFQALSMFTILLQFLVSVSVIQRMVM